MPIPLTGETLRASLKMRCDTSGAGYATYWAFENGKFVVADDYVTDARKAALNAKGLTKSFAEESEKVILSEFSDDPIATVRNTRRPVFIGNVTSVPLTRK